MRLTFLGTGSAMPTGRRMQSGLLLEAGDRRLLVDCGSGVLHRLAETNVGYEGVDTVLLTHHHLDHVADVLPLLKARWLADEEALTVVGPAGTHDLLAGLLDAHDYLQGRLDLTTRDVDPGSFAVAGFDVEAMETRHSMDCLAYRFGDAVTVSGDSEAFEALAAFADGSAVFVHDCSFPDDVDAGNHATPADLGAALAGHDYGTVYLTHLYPHTQGKHEAMLESVAERYTGDVAVAHDGLTLTV